MKNLSASVELSSLALESLVHPLSPSEMLRKVKDVLAHHGDTLGQLTGSHRSRHENFDDLSLDEYRLDCENSSLFFELVRFRPRGDWEVKGFRFE